VEVPSLSSQNKRIGKIKGWCQSIYLNVSGMYQAFNENRPFNDQDLYVEISRTIPTATTMAEQIKPIKRWADTRAVKASAA